MAALQYYPERNQRRVRAFDSVEDLLDFSLRDVEKVNTGYFDAKGAPLEELAAANAHYNNVLSEYDLDPEEQTESQGDQYADEDEYSESAFSEYSSRQESAPDQHAYDDYDAGDDEEEGHDHGAGGGGRTKENAEERLARVHEEYLAWAAKKFRQEHGYTRTDRDNFFKSKVKEADISTLVQLYLGYPAKLRVRLIGKDRAHYRYSLRDRLQALGYTLGLASNVRGRYRVLCVFKHGTPVSLHVVNRRIPKTPPIHLDDKHRQIAEHVLLETFLPQRVYVAYVSDITVLVDYEWMFQGMWYWNSASTRCGTLYVGGVVDTQPIEQLVRNNISKRKGRRTARRGSATRRAPVTGSQLNGTHGECTVDDDMSRRPVRDFFRRTPRPTPVAPPPGPTPISADATAALVSVIGTLFASPSFDPDRHIVVFRIIGHETDDDGRVVPIFSVGIVTSSQLNGTHGEATEDDDHNGEILGVNCEAANRIFKFALTYFFFPVFVIEFALATLCFYLIIHSLVVAPLRSLHLDLPFKYHVALAALSGGYLVYLGLSSYDIFICESMLNGSHGEHTTTDDTSPHPQVCQLNGSHGEVTQDDDMTGAGDGLSNDERAHRNRQKQHFMRFSRTPPTPGSRNQRRQARRPPGGSDSSSESSAASSSQPPDDPPGDPAPDAEPPPPVDYEEEGVVIYGAPLDDNVRVIGVDAITWLFQGWWPSLCRFFLWLLAVLFPPPLVGWERLPPDLDAGTAEWLGYYGLTHRRHVVVSRLYLRSLSKKLLQAQPTQHLADNCMFHLTQGDPNVDVPFDRIALANNSIAHFINIVQHRQYEMRLVSVPKVAKMRSLNASTHS